MITATGVGRVSFWVFALETRVALLPRLSESGANGMVRGPTKMSSNHDVTDEKIRRFEKAVRELIDEGHSFLDHRAWLHAAAARAGVDLQEVLPTRH